MSLKLRRSSRSSCHTSISYNDKKASDEEREEAFDSEDYEDEYDEYKPTRGESEETDEGDDKVQNFDRVDKWIKESATPGMDRRSKASSKKKSQYVAVQHVTTRDSFT
jgi:hypothetical protein